MARLRYNQYKRYHQELSWLQLLYSSRAFTTAEYYRRLQALKAKYGIGGDEHANH